MSLQDLKVPAAIFFVISIIFGNLGSFSSIQRGWHAQNIYHRCIMPSVFRVCTPGEVLGTILGIAAYYILSILLSFPNVLGIIVGCFVAAPIAYFVTRSRGSRIYAENVRRAGF